MQNIKQGGTMEPYKASKGFLIMMIIFVIIFLGFWIAAKIEDKLGHHIDTITGWA